MLYQKVLEVTTLFKNRKINIETAAIQEAELALTLFNNQRALSAEDKAIRLISIGSCVLLMDPGSPESIYYNRVKGFGSGDLDKLEQILEIYRAEGITPCFDLTPGAGHAEAAETLAAQGFYCADQLVFMAAGDKTELNLPEDVEIRPVTMENVMEFLALVVRSTGNDPGTEVLERKAAYFVRPEFRNYIAYLGGHAAGMGSLFMTGTAGYLANDYTFPDYRQRGIQSALLHRRITEAADLGLTALYTDVEFGTPSHDNMQRAKFRTVYMNGFWVKA
ncbi:GNAT family N-acetyltransferase [Paenibacillus sp. NFR01]|uniref:GNAT family N-acetyltransferase n=1 Tax=Paenibacillus sp. NFR01 TaxID=1566279 RepID=UPI00158723C8|nr:GNAT family N-acetyltransferase [Paenibacillus sp. NFR01]